MLHENTYIIFDDELLIISEGATSPPPSSVTYFHISASSRYFHLNFSFYFYFYLFFFTFHFKRIKLESSSYLITWAKMFLIRLFAWFIPGRTFHSNWLLWHVYRMYPLASCESSSLVCLWLYGCKNKTQSSVCFSTLDWTHLSPSSPTTPVYLILSVLGGDQRWTRHWSHRDLPWRQWSAARQDQRLLQRGHR